MGEQIESVTHVLNPWTDVKDLSKALRLELVEKLGFVGVTAIEESGGGGPAVGTVRVVLPETPLTAAAMVLDP